MDIAQVCSIYKIQRNSKMLFTYYLVFLGEDCFNHVKFTPKVHVIPFNTNIK